MCEGLFHKLFLVWLRRRILTHSTGKVDGLATDLRAEMNELRDQVVEGMNQQTETIVAAMEAMDRRQTVRLDDDETRISRLEHRAV